MKCQWMKIWLNKVWDTRKVLTNLFLMLNGHTCHRFVAWIWANESHPNRFIQLRTSVCKAPQTAKEGNQMSPVAALGQAMWMSQCVTLLHLAARDSSESRFWFSGGIHFTMLNTWLLTLSSTDLSPLPCISRVRMVRNRFAGQNRLFLIAFNWQKPSGSMPETGSGIRFGQTIDCLLCELVILISECAEIHKGEFSGFWWFLLVA